MKKIRTVAMAVVVGLFLSLVAGNAFAALWPINGTVIRAGVYDDQVHVVIKDQTAQANHWGANATPTLAKEILATALTALSGGLRVMGMYDTSTGQWVDMIISTE
jgi:hypothetical protein